MATCSNKKCNKETDRLKLTYCGCCYTRFHKYGDPNILKNGTRLLNPPDSLNEQQHNILTALMLGDGFLRRETKNKNANLSVCRTLSDIDYLKFQHEVFKNLCSDKAFSIGSSFDDRTNKTYYTCNLRTAALPVLTEYHNKWYKFNEETNHYKKIVPSDLELNAEIIANWICDDGTLSLNKKGDRIYSGIATNGFTKDEVYFLQELLNKRYNEYFSITTDKDEIENKQYVIHGADSATRTMLEDIQCVFPNSMSRKIIWKDILVANLPKYKSRKAAASERKEDIINYLATNNSFTFALLNEELDLYPLNGGFSPFKNILRNLQLYIDLGYIIKTTRPKGPDYVKGHIYTVSPSGHLFFLSQCNNQQSP